MIGIPQTPQEKETPINDCGLPIADCRLKNISNRIQSEIPNPKSEMRGIQPKKHKAKLKTEAELKALSSRY